MSIDQLRADLPTNLASMCTVIELLELIDSPTTTLATLRKAQQTLKARAAAEKFKRWTMAAAHADGSTDDAQRELLRQWFFPATPTAVPA